MDSIKILHRKLYFQKFLYYSYTKVMYTRLLLLILSKMKEI